LLHCCCVIRCCCHRCKRQQQSAGASTAAATGDASTPEEHDQQQKQQQLPEVLAAMHNMQLHVLQAARYAQQVQRLTWNYVTDAAEFGEHFDADAAGDDVSHEIMSKALGYANGLLRNEDFTDLAGMSAAAAAQLKQGLPAGRCGNIVLLRRWRDVAAAEYMYPRQVDEW
jgi:hypothetical protein